MTTIAALLFVLMPAPQGAPPPPPPPPLPTRSAPQTPTRDLPFRPTVGTALISGRVMTDERDPKPLRKATVTLRSDGFRTGWTFVTDDSGAFAFRNLPPGRYSLNASKPTYVSMSYGALKPGRPGQSIVLTDGQTSSNVVVKLPMGAVITGTVRDETGVPVANAQINVMRLVTSGGVRSQTFAGNGGLSRTDDRGVYRVFGLAAGEYSVSAVAPTGPLDNGKLRRVTPQEIDAALKSSDGGSTPKPIITDEDADLVKANVYYPGTTIESDAGAVLVSAGEERSGIDITLQFVPAVTIDGRLIGPEDKLPDAVTLTMMAVGSMPSSMRPRFGYPSRVDGTFSFSGVSPGQYVITARASSAPVMSENERNSSLFARADVMVNGRKLSNINLTLESGATVSGVISAAPTSTSALDPASLRVSLEPILGKTDVAIGVFPVSPDATGAFSISGVAPGRYRVTASPASTGRSWTLKSATAQGRDALDDGFEVTSADVSGVTVTMTNQSTEVSGILQDASGRAAPDFYIIAFPSDPKFWIPNSRRIKTARPGNDGKYIIRDLPPGDYRIAAVTDVETGEWFEPSFLQQLVAASATLTLVDGEKKSFPLKIGGSDK